MEISVHLTHPCSAVTSIHMYVRTCIRMYICTYSYVHTVRPIAVCTYTTVWATHAPDSTVTCIVQCSMYSASIHCMYVCTCMYVYVLGVELIGRFALSLVQ